MNSTIGWTAIAALVALGCVGEAAGGDDDAKRIVTACRETTNMSAEICDCVGGRATTDLSDQARAFLVATLAKDEAEVEKLRGKLSVPDAMQAGMFMVNAPAACASGATPK